MAVELTRTCSRVKPEPPEHADSGCYNDGRPVTELGEFQFDPMPGPSHGGPPRWQYAAVVIGGLALVAAAVVAVYLVRRGPAETVPLEAPAAAGAVPTDESVEATEEVLDDVEPIDLPPLDESDSLIRDLVAALSAHPTFVA